VVRRRGWWGALIVAAAAWALVAAPGAGPPPGKLRRDPPVASDDQTFRPTVVIRRGNTQGSGSVIASIDGETLILTVAHVVNGGSGDVFVELHRYNLGVERQPSPYSWPRRWKVEIVAIDVGVDLAILRIRHMTALPYVARLADPDAKIPAGTLVTSVGIDQGAHLSSWTAHVHGVVQLDPKDTGTERPYLITDRAPEHGRSGGGLFLGDGTLAGACVGRVDRRKGNSVGVFATLPSIDRLIRDHNLQSTIALSDNRHFIHPKNPLGPGPTAVTPTNNRQPPPGR
jgi:S1-C subfamily serine protease